MNKIREITKEQYLQTMGKHMKNVTDNAEVIADIWGYAKCLLERKLISEYGFNNNLIEAVYINDNNTYQHILLFTDKKNCYVVIIVDVLHRVILGHYFLDLNQEYDIN